MIKSYYEISPELAGRIRLVMTDVDGTLVASGNIVSPVVVKTITRLQETGIIVGLISGRTLPELETMASHLAINGPIIAENGGVAKLKNGGEFIDLGFSRQPAIKALEKIKELFPDAIKEREDNRERLVDVVFWSYGVTAEELRVHLDGVQLLDSGYILHLMQEGISKGGTLMRLLEKVGNTVLSPAEVMVFGDSLTDISLFKMFSNSVLVINPKLPVEQKELLWQYAGYVSDLPYDEGFVEVAWHIVKARHKRI